MARSKKTVCTVNFQSFLYKGDIFCDFVSFPAHKVPSGKGSTLKVKNLLPMGANSFLLP